MTEDVLITYYSNAILAIKCAHVAGKPVLAKPALLVASIDAIRKKKALNNKLFYDNLKEAYSNVCSEYHIKETPMNYPFYFMASESFWNLHWNCVPIKTKAPSEKMLHDKVDYAFLDNALWDLLQDAGNRARLKEAVVNHYFNIEQPKRRDLLQNTKSTMTLTELKKIIIKSLGIGVNYADFYMRKFRKLYKGDKRAIDDFQAKYTNGGSTVTFTITACGETIEHTFPIIKWSERHEAEVDTIDETSFSEEATNTQLHYLKRDTGIDYNNRGLTKRQASKMIQECIEGEGGDGLSSTGEQGSTRPTQQEKQPDPEPGSLEDILSKCKTREEQLEAARKFFGEDK